MRTRREFNERGYSGKRGFSGVTARTLLNEVTTSLTELYSEFLPRSFGSSLQADYLERSAAVDDADGGS
jgi:hypothetical protein